MFTTIKDNLMMRVRPSVPVGVGLAVGYMALFGGLFALSGVDYDDLSNSADNTLKAIVIPLAVAAVVLVIVTSVLGWWKPVLRETTRVRGWLVVVPILMVVATLAGINYGGLGDIDSKLLLWIVVGTLLIGFCEELMYRGLVLVGFRGGMREAFAWFWSSVAFGLLHSINFLLGQDLLPTLQQVVMTFLIGSGFYIARRTTGVIFVPMAMHTLWDFSSFTGDGYALSAALGMISLLAVLVGLIAGRHHLFPKANESSMQAAHG
jgi:membrane protease YdiL (CAAX protease family)